jgi:hypothetical protein
MNHTTRRWAFLLAGTLSAAGTLGLTGCSHGGGVTRVNPDAQIDLSGRWNDTDANMVAEAMMDECLKNGWADKHAAAHPGQAPVVRLYPIRNRSNDHINDQFFTKRVEAVLLNSGKVKVVATYEESADNRGERFDQEKHASDATKKPDHQETGSDYVLNGWVVSQDDEVEGAAVKAYLVTMELSNTMTNEKVWIGEKRIKKVVQRGE